MLVAESKQRILDKLKDEINQLLGKSSKDTEDWLEKVFKVGEKVKEAQKLFDDEGQWLKWCDENLHFRRRWLYFHLQCYDNRESIFEHFLNESGIFLPSMREVQRFLAKTKPAKKGKITIRETCPTCGQRLTKLAKAYMNRTRE